MGSANMYGKTVLVCSVLFVALIVLALRIGHFDMTNGEFLDVIADTVTNSLRPDEELAHQVVFDIRLPRIMLAALVGAGLAVCGASLQGAFQNPLVSPDLLGVCSGAGFGCALGILLFNEIGVPAAVLSFIFGIGSIVLVFFLSGAKRQSDMLSIVLSGIIASAIFTALISLVKYVADTSDQLPAITYWLMGSFTNASFSTMVYGAVPILVGTIMLLSVRWKINMLSLGDEDCRASGADPSRIRWTVIAMSALCAAGCVVESGIIGWVGLVIPHISRSLVGPNHGHSMPAACIIGAIFMLAIDTVARNATASEIPVGILTALIGAPFFIVVYNRMRGPSA
ncbi:MAG: iron ABC transporter permease [Candidatus Methanomethylophilaceae archaeon]|nr:iron ABC transporter permease [Candidatus Methanomethylophilaceae archaeon]